MRADRYQFAMQSYEYAEWSLRRHPDFKGIVHPDVLDKVCLYGAAQACLESTYGTSKAYLEHNNPLGIKPVGDQPGVWPIRSFPSVGCAWNSWAYLVCKSTNFVRSRKWITGKRRCPCMWGILFSDEYCPEDRKYASKVEQIELAIKKERYGF